jgi:hypothetical protein
MAKSTLIGLGILCLSVAGCSSTDDFVGTWKVTSGQTLYNCEGTALAPEQATGTITFSEGSSSDLIMVQEECTFKFDVDDERASLAGSHSCTTSIEGSTAIVNTSSLTFSTSDGKVGHISGSGSVIVSGITCTFSLTADYEKL